MHKFLLYASYGWLLLDTTLYFGLHSAYTLGQVLVAVVALLLIRNDVPFFGEWPGWAAWLVLCVAFISYREPRIVIVLFAILLAGAALAR